MEREENNKHFQTKKTPRVREKPKITKLQSVRRAAGERERIKRGRTEKRKSNNIDEEEQKVLKKARKKREYQKWGREREEEKPGEHATQERNEVPERRRMSR